MLLLEHNIPSIFWNVEFYHILYVYMQGCPYNARFNKKKNA